MRIFVVFVDPYRAASGIRALAPGSTDPLRGRVRFPGWIEIFMATVSDRTELIDVVVRLPRKAIEDTLLSASASDAALADRRLGEAKALLTGRRQRVACFAGVRFHDPSWEMILELYVATRENRPLAVSHLCSLSGGSSTTALRHIEHLEALRYIRRETDTADRRRTNVRMLPALSAAAEQWLDLQLAALRIGC